jgi:hypothetical protein
MKMKLGRWGVLLSLVVALVVLPGSAFAQDVDILTPLPDGSGGGGSSCSYCSQDHCGCGAAPAGMRLASWSCECGGGQGGTCNQNCNFVRL